MPGPTRLRGLAVAWLAAAGLAGCWRIGEPTQSPALITWVAYPESVRTGAVFSFEFAGPISTTTCGRLDTATLAIEDSIIALAALRSTFEATCAPQRVSFYEARPIRLERPGVYRVRSPGPVDLGAVVATDSGNFTPVYTRGEGTLREVAGCWLFGPGWLGKLCWS
ncbi:MAG: hypothetical protein R3266_03890 [Gemmatimonadota bacterium]|nr:hypothetical protein [Gemmatimonadota bacterium]